MGASAIFENGENGITVLKQRVSFRELLIVILAMLMIISACSVGIALIFHTHTVKKLSTKNEIHDIKVNVTINVTEECITFECLAASATASAFMDPSQDPCESFYHYACGNWQKFETKASLHPDERERTIFHIMREENEKRLLAVLEKPETKGKAYETKMKDFFISCLDEYRRTSDGAQSFIEQILNQSGGWNLLHADWNPSSYDLNFALRKVHVDFWKSALFEIHVRPDWLDSSINTIQLIITYKMDTELLTSKTTGFTVGGITFSKRELALSAVAFLGLCVLIVVSVFLGITVTDNVTDIKVINNTSNRTVKIKVKFPECTDPGCLESAARMFIMRNASTNPCDDFYNYACGGFVKYHPDMTMELLEYTTFSRMRNENEERLRSALEAPLQRKVDWASELKVKNFFQSCVDTYSNSKNASKRFITEVLNEAGGWAGIETWDEASYTLTNALKKIHIDFWKSALFRIKVEPDWLDRTKNSVQIDLGGLTLYWWEYTYTDERARRLHEAAKKFMATVAELVIRDSGVSISATDRHNKAQEFADDVFELEHQIANMTWNTLPSDNPHAHENRKTVSELGDMSTIFNWVDILTTMFHSAGVNRNTKVVLLEGDYLKELDQLIKALPNAKRTLNNYFTWRLMHGYVTDLGWEYIHANREFYVARTGSTEFLGVQKACFNLVQRHFSDALGALFVRDHLVDGDKSTVDDIVAFLKQGLADRLQNVTWMDDKTRNIAIDKEMNIIEKLGYPAWMVDNDYLDNQYKNLQMSKDDYLGNLISIASYERILTNNRLQNGEDKGLWRFKVYDTAGVYDNNWNELLIPAGLLQWPVYAKHMPKYYNFGSLGANLAHEIINAIDEIGGYYLKNGTYYDWWTPQTTENYNRRRACLEDLDVQAGPYIDPVTEQPIYVKIDGGWVARELISETGALRMGYYAYKDWLVQNGEEKTAPGLNLTNEQTYFLAFAQTQCFVRRDSYAITRARRHTLPEDLRVNMALAHTPEFAQVFNCPAGSRMKSNETCEVF